MMRLFFLFMDVARLVFYGFFVALATVAFLKDGITISSICLLIFVVWLVSDWIRCFGRGWVEPLRSKPWRL